MEHQASPSRLQATIVGRSWGHGTTLASYIRKTGVSVILFPQCLVAHQVLWRGADGQVGREHRVVVLDVLDSLRCLRGADDQLIDTGEHAWSVASVRSRSVVHVHGEERA